MSTLAERLAAADGPARESLARATAREAPTEELIDAVLELAPSGWTEHHLIQPLYTRGADVFEPVAAALLANPRAAGAGSLAEVLTQLYDDDDIRDPRVVPALVAAANAALDAGAGTAGVSTYLLKLRDCAAIAGSELPEAAPLALRVLALAATENEPDVLATVTAKGLLGER